MLQAALLRHRLLVLLGPHDVLCGQRLRRPHDLLRSAAFLLHGFGLVLLGSRRLLLGPGRVLLRTGRNLLRSQGKLLHPLRHLLLGSRRQLLRSVGLASAFRISRGPVQTDRARVPLPNGAGGPVIFIQHGLRR